jgi:hypothetical protein
MIKKYSNSIFTTILKSKLLFLVVITSFLIYLILGTGLHGDDLSTIVQFSDWSFLEWVTPNPVRQEIFLLSFPSYLLFFWAYWLFENNFYLLYDLIKILMHLFFLWSSYQFFKNYIPRDRAIIASIIFILNPIHDATIYWYMCLPYLFSTSLILVAHKLINSNYLKAGSLICALGAFSFYSSPPYILGLSVIFLIERNYKKFLIFLIPGITYIFFYIGMKIFTQGVERRFDISLGFENIIQNLFLQPITMIDSFIGPGYFLKIISSIHSISIVGLVISIILGVYANNFFKRLTPSSHFKDKKLLTAVCLVLIISFAMYSITGLYNHSPFNLGNRSTLYGSLVFAVIFSYFIPARKTGSLIFLIFFIIPSVGLSEHWKEWNQNQLTVTHQVKNHSLLSSLPLDSLVFVKGNFYSELGAYSHIEFLIMPWTLKAMTPEGSQMIALTNYIEINEMGVIIDKKWSKQINLSNNLFIYDSNNNSLVQISKDDLISQLGNQPKIIRHWIQLLEGTKAHEILISVYPRISYIF